MSDERDYFVSASCGGERCRLCRNPAAAKIGEEIAMDDPAPHRHNLTSYVCREHFIEIFGIHGVKIVDEFRKRGVAGRALMLPCPKCGSGDVRWCNISVRPHCGDCGYWAPVNFGSAEEAVIAWNKKAKAATLDELTAESERLGLYD